MNRLITKHAILSLSILIIAIFYQNCADVNLIHPVVDLSVDPTPPTPTPPSEERPPTNDEGGFGGNPNDMTGVNKIVVDQNDRILIGGNFTSYQGAPNRKYLVRLNPDGSLDTSFMPAAEAQDKGVLGAVYDLAVSNNGIFVVGSLSKTPTAKGTHIVKLEENGEEKNSVQSSFPNLFQSTGYRSAVVDNGDIITKVRYTTHTSSFRSDAIERRDSNLNLKASAEIFFGGREDTYGGKGIVHSILPLTSSMTLLAGEFKKIVSGSSTDHYNNIAYVDQNLKKASSAFNNLNFNGPIHSLAKHGNGVLIGGSFNYVHNGKILNNLVRFDQNGNFDSSFNSNGTGFNYNVYDITAQQDGKVIVVGDFTEYNGHRSPRIIRLNADGSIDSSFSAGQTGFDRRATTVAVQSDGTILVGGVFNMYKGNPHNNYAALRPNGESKFYQSEPDIVTPPVCPNLGPQVRVYVGKNGQTTANPTSFVKYTDDAGIQPPYRPSDRCGNTICHNGFGGWAAPGVPFNAGVGSLWLFWPLGKSPNYVEGHVNGVSEPFLLDTINFHIWELRPHNNSRVMLRKGDVSSGSHVISISECPGDFRPSLASTCRLGNGDISWATGNRQSAMDCNLDPDKTYYINLAAFDLEAHDNCILSGDCPKPYYYRYSEEHPGSSQMSAMPW